MRAGSGSRLAAWMQTRQGMGSSTSCWQDLCLIQGHEPGRDEVHELQA